MNNPMLEQLSTSIKERRALILQNTDEIEALKPVLVAIDENNPVQAEQLFSDYITTYGQSPGLFVYREINRTVDLQHFINMIDEIKDKTELKIKFMEMSLEYIPLLDKALELIERADGHDINFIAQGAELDAASAILSIYSTITKNAAKSMGKNNASFADFQQAMKESLSDDNGIKADVEQLKSHRGLKSLIMNFLGFIGLLGVGYAIGCIYEGRFPLFQPETKSGILIDEYVTNSILATPAA